ncbi:hypothetical protein OIDMADRAFT_36482 [Oidiodendron maius Zn]|uniref:Amino acid permease/ SLC12A domain-containing protein n=1 Tax=Oidiodendron maius (strain Zn) TaxID=913774 RepID=A0A0C3GQ39_OIDMZ|nr:hypothetical protein OIDMADRAFT_36482 [Oidiodendron maius Zn]
MDDTILKRSTSTSAPTTDKITPGEVIPVTDSNFAQRFNLLSTLGISFSITATPLGIGTYLSVVIGVGGSPVYFYGYLVAVGLNLLVCISLAEIAAVHPHASGQIWWTAVLAPKRYARGLSYITGWLTGAAWFFWLAAASLITSQLIWALVCVCHNLFVVQPWHYYVLYVAATLVALLFNIPLVKVYPYLLKGVAIYINAGAFFVLVALLVQAHPKQSAKFVFADFVNLTGWSSNGIVFMLGLLPGSVAVNGFDSAAHMAEEMDNPRKQVPQVMVGSAVLSAMTGVPMILVYMFCNVAPDNLLTPIGGQPVAQLMLDALHSLPLTIIGILIFIITLVAATTSIMTTFSRVWWSFAREGGVPFSMWLSQTDTRWKLPVNAILFSFVATLLIGLIEIGSSTAINAILGTSVLCIFASYSIPIFCLVIDRRRALAGKRYFSLGRAGMTINVVALLWMVYDFVWLCFPLYLPINSTTMNYSVAVFAGVMLVTAINWFCYSKDVYVVPKAMVFNVMDPIV